MGHESQIELWSPKLTTFCFAGFGTNRFRCQEAMKTAGRENPKRWALVPSNRAHGAVGQNNSRSIKWAAKQEKFQPKEKCFFLTSTFIELSLDQVGCEARKIPAEGEVFFLDFYLYRTYQEFKHPIRERRQISEVDRPPF